jgi:hypothetical protein
MRRFAKSLAMGVAALALLLGGQAQAGVVTFDDAAGNAVRYNGYGVGGSFTDQGLKFTNLSGGGVMYVWDGGSPNSNGTNNNIFGFGSGDTEEITRAGGGAFDLYSIDLAISWYDPNATDGITINGNPLTITTTLTTYTLNLLGVTAVDITGVDSGSGYWLADNISTSVPVPEPAALTLLALGIAGLAGYGLRRRKQAAAAAN